MIENNQINLNKFREEFKIPAAALRGFCKSLGLEIIKVDNIPYIVGANKHGVENYYLLKHAVLEWRRTHYITNTVAGKFYEFTEETDLNGIKIITEYGVSKINPDDIKGVGPSLVRKPNKQSVGITPPSTEDISITPAPEARPAAPQQQQEALTALLTALTAAAPVRETLHPQKQLLEAAEQSFRLTSSQLAELLSMSSATISSKKSGFIKLGFCYTKIKEGSATLWKVSKID